VPVVEGAPVQDAGWLTPFADGNSHGLLAVYSLILATFLGTMGLPHVLGRFYTNPDGRAARRSAVVALGMLGAFYLLVTLLGALSRLYTPQLLVSGETDAAVLLLPTAVLGNGWAGTILGGVVAAGAWSGHLLSPLGIHLPLEAERGYHAILPDHNLRLELPIGFKDRGFSVTPMASGLRVAGTVEFSGLNAPPDMERARRLVQHAAALFPGIKHGEPELWSGYRPSTPDSLPVIGPANDAGDLLLAFGHSHFGITGAPGTARIISELLHHKREAGQAAFSAACF